MALLDLRELEFVEAPSVLYGFAEELKNLFSRAEESIKVFGEAHWMLYSFPLVLDSLCDRYRQGVRIDFVVGPALPAWRMVKERRSGILDLAEGGVLRLYSRTKRGSESHFIIIDGKRAWIEDYHSPLLPLADRRHRETTCPEELAKVSAIFSGCLQRLKPSISLRQDFVLLAPSQINFIIFSGSNFDELGKEELQGWLERCEEAERRAIEVAQRNRP